MTAEEIRMEALRLAKAGHDWRAADYIIKAADKLAAFITSGTVPSEPPAPVISEGDVTLERPNPYC